jgi:hypothetical protein
MLHFRTPAFYKSASAGSCGFNKKFRIQKEALILVSASFCIYF